MNAKWRHPNRKGRALGAIQNAKEQLIRDLRPKTKAKPTRDYEECDGPKVARHVRALNLVAERHAQSASFERFSDKVRNAKL